MLHRILLACGLLALALAARTWGLFETSIWVDDTWSIAAATGHSLDVHLDGMTAGENYGNPQNPMPASYFLQYIAPQAGNTSWRVARDSFATESHPPLFYVLLHLWMRVFGYSVNSGRALSLLFSLATVVLLFFLTQRLAGETAAWIASLLCILAPFQSQISLQIRGYALMGLLALATGMITMEMLESGPDAGRVRWLICLGIAGMLVHYYFCLYAAVQGVALLTQRRLWPTALKVGTIWTSVLAALAVYVHFQPSFLAQPWMVSPWAPPLLLLNAGSAISELLVLNLDTCLGLWFPAAFFWPAKALLVAVVGLLLFAAHRRLPTRQTLFLTAWLAGTVLLMFALDLARNSGTVMTARYMVGSSFPLYLLLAVGLSHVRLAPRVLLTTVLALAMIAGQLALRALPVGTLAEGADYRKAASEIQKGWQAGDLVIVDSSYSVSAISLAYYLPPQTPILALIYLPRAVPGPVVMPANQDDLQERLNRWAAGDIQAGSASRFAGRQHIWVIRSYAQQSWNTLFNWLNPRFRLVNRDHYGSVYLGEMVRKGN